MSEWLKEAVLKTVEEQSSVGSNPTPSARKVAELFLFDSEYSSCVWGICGEMAESAEGARLLSECRVKNSTEGSNPSLSATPLIISTTYKA
jgi:hypothetical protein